MNICNFIQGSQSFTNYELASTLIAHATSLLDRASVKHGRSAGGSKAAVPMATVAEEAMTAMTSYAASRGVQLVATPAPHKGAKILSRIGDTKRSVAVSVASAAVPAAVPQPLSFVHQPKPRSCSFCKSATHVEPACALKSSMGAEIFFLSRAGILLTLQQQTAYRKVRRCSVVLCIFGRSLFLDVG
jgi:hypothetical protein